MLWKKEYITKNRTFYRVESLDHFKRRKAFNILLNEGLMNEELMHKLLGNKSFVYIFPSYNYLNDNCNPFVSISEEDIPDSIDGELIEPEYIEATINIIDTSKLTNIHWRELFEFSPECNNKELYKDGELTEWGTLWLLNNSSILKKMKLKPQLLLNILNYSDVEEELENSYLNDDEDNY